MMMTNMFWSLTEVLSIEKSPYRVFSCIKLENVFPAASSYLRRKTSLFGIFRKVRTASKAKSA